MFDPPFNQRGIGGFVHAIFLAMVPFKNCHILKLPLAGGMVHQRRQAHPIVFVELRKLGQSIRCGDFASQVQ